MAATHSREATMLLEVTPHRAVLVGATLLKVARLVTLLRSAFPAEQSSYRLRYSRECLGYDRELYRLQVLLLNPSAL